MIERIRGRDAFRRFAGGHRSNGGLVTVVVAPAAGEHPGLAFAVPRRVGSAVLRNRLRRQLRAAAQELDRAGRLPPAAYLVIVHPTAAGRRYHELFAAFDRALSRAGGATP